MGKKIKIIFLLGAIFLLSWTTVFAQPRRGAGPIARGTPLWWDGTRTDWILDDDLIIEDIHPGIYIWCIENNVAFGWHYHMGTTYPIAFWRLDNGGVSPNVPLMWFDEDDYSVIFPHGNFQVDASGNVTTTGTGRFDGGIGVGTAPSFPLHILQSADSQGIRIYGFEDLDSTYFDMSINQFGTGYFFGSSHIQLVSGTGNLYLQTGSNAYVILSDAAGSSTFNFQDSGQDTVASIDSNGNITVEGTVDGIDIATDVAANTTHRGDNSQAHTDYLINTGSDSTAGTITAAGFTTTGVIVTGDHGTEATDQVVNVCYGTVSPPPMAANTTTIGAIYYQYIP